MKVNSFRGKWLRKQKGSDSSVKCPYTTSDTRNYRIHIKAVHDNIRDEICDECGRGFKRKYTLKMHVKQVHSELKDHACQECGRGFKVLGSLKKHEKAVHHKKKSHTCDACKKGFSSLQQLRSHDEVQNLKRKKVVVCNKCETYFMKKSDLKKQVKFQISQFLPASIAPHQPRLGSP